MKSMERQIAILNSNGTLPLPSETRASLGLHARSQLLLPVENGRIVLEPLKLNDLDELCGIFSSTPGLEDELQSWRDQDSW